MNKEELEKFMHEEDEKMIKQLRESNKESLKSYKDSEVVKYVEILSCENACENCKEWSGKKILVEEAIEKELLPIKSCSNIVYGYCRCTYLPVIEED